MPINIKKKLQHGMTVGQLKEILENFDDETPVLIGYDYGDHWHSQVADRIDEPDGPMVIEWSDYHNKFKVSTDYQTIEDAYEDNGLNDTDGVDDIEAHEKEVKEKVEQQYVEALVLGRQLR